MFNYSYLSVLQVIMIKWYNSVCAYYFVLYFIKKLMFVEINEGRKHQSDWFRNVFTIFVPINSQHENFV